MEESTATAADPITGTSTFPMYANTSVGLLSIEMARPGRFELPTSQIRILVFYPIELRAQ